MIKDKIKVFFVKGRVITEDSDEAGELYNQSRFGTVLKNNKVQLSMIEALYLSEKGKIVIFDGRNKEILPEKFLKKAAKAEPNIWTRYAVFKNILAY